MRQAHLPQDAVAALTAQHVGHPHLWPDRAEQRAPHHRAPAGLDDMSAASVPMNTHSHQFLPFTRTEVSSEQTTGLANTTFSIAAVAPSRGCRARAKMLLIAPSLIDNENSSSINS